MIRKLLRKVFHAGSRSTAGSDRSAVHRVPQSAHGIPREAIMPFARKVCLTLQEAGYQAYIVGGAVRDLMLKQQPKDFDVATNATPEQVRALFRRSRIIGRRFKIVHVLNGPDVVEVSTFRSLQEAQTDEHGRITRDNAYGTQEEDATRRDFTVNALYYDPATEVIVDYHQGVSDLKTRVLRIIGDPKVRYREDPVRMLRAVRLAAKLDLSIDPVTRAPIQEMAPLLGHVPAARLFDEMLKLLSSGHAVRCIKQLRAEGLHHGLLPLLDVILEQPAGERFIWLVLENTDDRVRSGKSISPGFLFATLLWHQVLGSWEKRKAVGMAQTPALFEAMDEVLSTQAEKLAITRRIVGDIKDIWALQPRFEKRSGKMPYRLVEQPRYRAGWDFLKLRAEAGEVPMAWVDWWHAFAQGNSDERSAMLLPATGEVKRRRRRRKPVGERSEKTPVDVPSVH